MIRFGSFMPGMKTFMASSGTFRAFLKPSAIKPPYSVRTACSTQTCKLPVQECFGVARYFPFQHMVPGRDGNCKRSISNLRQLNFYRDLHTSHARLVYYERPPRQKIIRNQNFFQYMWYQIPDWAKLCGGVAIGAYLFVKIAVPLMIVVLPPLIVGGWMYKKVRTYSEAKIRHEDYTILQQSSLVYTPPRRGSFLVPPPEQINSEIANFEINRIIDAFWSNEGGIADYFKIGPITNIALGSLEASSYDIDDSDSTPVLYAFQQRSLYNKALNRKVASCIFGLRTDQMLFPDQMVDPTANIGPSTCFIRIKSYDFGGKEFIIDTPSEFSDNDEPGYNNDDIIDVKGKTRDL